MSTMQGSALEKLFFSVALIDKVTKPAKGVGKAFKKIYSQARQGFMEMGRGALTLTAVGVAMSSISAPARDFSKALNEVGSLGTQKSELKALGKASKRFALDFGGSAAEIARSGYDIQSSINGLSNGELAKFTYAGAVLAKGTKSSAEIITDYTGTMYGIFEKTANKVGKARWIEMMTGQTATAVRMFKTTGSKMAEAFSKLGSAGEKAGIKMSDQMAVLGTLGATMSGSESATRFNAFIQGIGKAQKSLKLKFTDAKGQMLPIVEILEKIKASKFGDLSKIANQDALKNAFGTKEAVQFIQNLMGKTGQLKKSMVELGKVKGMEPAVKMAKTMVDPLEKFQSTLDVLKITVGQGILPVLNLVLTGMTKALVAVNWMAENIPGFNYLIAGIILAVGTLATGIGTMWAVLGAGKILYAFYLKMVLVRNVLIAKNFLLRHATVAQNLYNFSVRTGQLIMEGFVKILKFFRLNLLWSKAALFAKIVAMKIAAGVMWLLNGGLMAATSAVWAFTVALLTNPITWVVIGIMALIGAISLCVKYWDKLKAAFNIVVDFIANNWQWLLAGMLGPVGIAVKLIIDYWDEIVSAVSSCFDKISGFWTGLWDFGKGIVSSILGWIIGKIESFLGWMTHIPFIGGKIQKGLDKMKEFAGVEVNQTKVEQPAVSAVTDSRHKDVTAGGIKNNVNNKTTNYGGVTINTTSPVGPGQMEEMWALQS